MSPTSRATWLMPMARALECGMELSFARCILYTQLRSSAVGPSARKDGAKVMKEGRSNEISGVVFLNAKPETCDEFLQLLAPVLDDMRHEPTFISAVLHRSPEDP